MSLNKQDSNFNFYIHNKRTSTLSLPVELKRREEEEEEGKGGGGEERHRKAEEPICRNVCRRLREAKESMRRDPVASRISFTDRANIGFWIK